MKDQLASEASIQKATRAALPGIQKATKSSKVCDFFQTLMARGVDGRDTFKSRQECVQLIREADEELHKYICDNEGFFRDLEILERGAPDSVGMTPLMWACLFNWEMVVRILIEQGASCEARMNCDRTLLMLAAWRSSPSLVSLISTCAPSLVGETDINRDSALTTAITHNRLEIIRTLIENDKDHNQLDYDTGLMKAIDLKLTAVALLLIPKVSNVDSGPRRTPYLYKAAVNGCVAIAEALIKQGADVNKIKNASGTNALMEAARQGHTPVVDLLLKNKADPNLASDFEEDNDNGYTALHFAARFNEWRTIELLKQHGANIFAESHVKRYTPFVVAIRYNSLEAQKLLATGRCELPILMEAVRSKSVDSVDNLLSTSDYQTSHVDEALVEASSNGYSNICKLLLNKYAADSNAESNGLNCVLLASMKGHLETVRILLEKNADFMRTDSNSASAIHYLMACNADIDLIEKLVAKYGMGAFCKRDKQGRTAIQYANKEETLVKLLRLDDENNQSTWLTRTDIENTETDSIHSRNLRVSSDSFSEAAIKFEGLGHKILDNAIQPIGYGPLDENLEVKVNFSLLYKQNPAKKDALPEDVLEVLQSNESSVLSHPVTKLLLLKKYRGFPRWYARCQFWLYFLLALSFTAGTILHVAGRVDAYRRSSKEEQVGKGFSLAALVLSGLSMLFELLLLDEKGFKYFTRASSWFRLLTYAGAITATVFQLFIAIDPEERQTEDGLLRGLQCFVMLGLFFNMLLTLRRSAIYGVYVSVFCNVLENVTKLMVPIGSLILAFSAAFYCIYQDDGQYSGLGNTGFKVISMMMGSVEPEEVAAAFSSNWPIFIAQTALFLTFLIFMAVITMNLLIGIAIGDIAAEIPLAKQTHLNQLADHIIQSENIARAIPFLDRLCYKEQEYVLTSAHLNQYRGHKGIMDKFVGCFAPKTTPQFEREIIDELKAIVNEIYIRSNSH